MQETWQGRDHLHQVIDEFIGDKRFGEIVIKIEAGKIVVIKKSETIKLS